MDFTHVIENLPLYFQGLWVTVQLLVLALALGLLIALPIGIAAGSRSIWINAFPRAFIYFMRGTPLLVQIFLIYNGMGQFEAIRESFIWPVFKQAYWCALIAFALNTAGYTAEIIRGTIKQTPRGEIEAAKASGMSVVTQYRRIILPSTFRRMLPAYGNEVIFMLHGTALAGFITIVDILGAAKYVNSRYYIPFESYITAGLFYLCLTFMIVLIFKHLEKRYLSYLTRKP